MTPEYAFIFARAVMVGVLEQASRQPAEDNIAHHARLYIEQLDAGEWDDSIEQVIHAGGWLDCQLQWWRTMSDTQRGYVRFYRDVFSRIKMPEPNKLTSRTKAPGFTQAWQAAAKSRTDWGFAPRGGKNPEWLEFGERYDIREGILKESVVTRGQGGGRKASV